MSAKYLHIVSFNVPYPANYGGIIDIYFKLKALRKAGIQIILHCYTYGRSPARELEELCYKVHYYSRDAGLRYFLSRTPYIVRTRDSSGLVRNLLSDPFPILFEGLHTTAPVKQCIEANKKILIRAHNIEHRYYSLLAKTERNPFRKIFFRSEAGKLEKHEEVLKEASYILSIAKHETAYFENKYQNAVFIPAFHRFDEISAQEGKGDFILFHGNLSVTENSEMFLFLLKQTLHKTAHQVIVAGKGPSDHFRRKIGRYSKIKLIANPDDREMEALIRDAHINLLFTRQATGIKLKLLHALHAGRHALVNPPMVEGSGLDHLCHVVKNDRELPELIDSLMLTSFSPEQVQERKKALKDHSNRAGAEKILRLLA